MTNNYHSKVVVDVIAMGFSLKLGFQSEECIFKWSVSLPWYSEAEQGWRSGESARLPPIWPRAICGSVEFVVVGSRPCSEGFSPGSPVIFPPQKLTSPSCSSYKTCMKTSYGWCGFLSKYCKTSNKCFLMLELPEYSRIKTLKKEKMSSMLSSGEIKIQMQKING